MPDNATPDQVTRILSGMIAALHARPADAHLIPPLMIWGAPGIGKSALVREVATEHGLGLVDVRLAQREPVDMRGLPVPDGDSVRWLVASEWPRDPQSRGIIFFDELTAADSTLQAAAYELILDRRLGDLYQVPAGWYIVAAGNRLEDQAVSAAMSSALANRFCHLELGADTSSWLRWARRAELHPDVLAFLAWRPNLLFSMPAFSQRGWPSPRSWERVSYVLKMFDASGVPQEEDLLTLQVAGLVGQDVATEFMAFHGARFEGPSAREVLFDGTKPVIPERADHRFAFATALIHEARGSALERDGAWKRLLEVTDLLGSDLAAMIVSAVLDSATRPMIERLVASPEMRLWRQRHGASLGPAWAIGSGVAAQDAPTGTDEALFDPDRLLEGAR